MFSESQILPYSAVTSLGSGPVLVFAPHPDDEVFGCGGAILRHVEAGDTVHVVIVTDGAHGTDIPDYASVRQRESTEAAAILGYGSPILWNLPDRGLEYGEFLIERILDGIEAHRAELVYAPSWWEIHPDHRVLALAVLEAVRRCSRPVRLALYEVGAPLHPNTLLDITDILDRKQAAVACFQSQLQRQPYDQQIAALNRFRTYTLPATVRAAEAYHLLSQEEAWKKPLTARSLGIPGPNDPDDVAPPLVSVIIRSMDRASLREALDSVALQTYPHIEIVVVNAKGGEHSELPPRWGRFPLRFISSDIPLRRSRAANTGLEHVRGEYLIFLDDDDIFYPDHIATLVGALRNQDQSRCAYAGVRVEFYGAEGQLVSEGVFNEPFRAEKLHGRNFIPIHAVLFHRSLLDLGCRFDETLDLLEDWDFWLQVSQYTSFIHIDRITACYRNHGESGLGEKIGARLLAEATGAVFDKWRTIWTGVQWADAILHRDAQREQTEQWAISMQTQLTEREAELTQLRNHLSAYEEELERQKSLIADLQRDLDEKGMQLEQNRQLIAKLTDNERRAREDLESVSAWANHMQRTLDEIHRSTSWRITGPMRIVARLVRGQYREAWNSLRRPLRPLGKALYVRLPPQRRTTIINLAYRLAGPVFTGFNDYERWKQSHQPSRELLPASSWHPEAPSLTGMVDIERVPVLTSVPQGRIAVHAHIFYPDLAAEIANHLRHIPYPFDLYVSTSSETARQICVDVFSKLPLLGRLTVSVVPNRGRDIAPMFCTFGPALMNYDFIGHIHSKKSLYNNGATSGWREYLLENLLGSEEQIQRIFTLLTSDEHIGLVYPQNFSGLPYIANTWLSNRSLGLFWCQKLGIRNPPVGYFSYPAGSMFWARTQALRPLFDSGIRLEDFPEEAGQTDGTLAHCLERMLPLVTGHSGFRSAILLDRSNPSWSPWRLEQYISRDPKILEAMISPPEIRVVVFDIFDTLLVRPLLNPESTKAIIARRAGGDVARAYLAARVRAEVEARQQAGRDVGLDAIYEKLAEITDLSSEAIAELRLLEEAVECDVVARREDAVRMFRYAQAQGKRIVLASDMYLTRSTIESVLRNNGIDGWDALYLSSDIGLRKDSGELYRHILACEHVSPAEVLVIGDNEHSDIQIPEKMGFQYYHVLRPVEVARALPRLSELVEDVLASQSLDAELTLGLLVRANFSPLFFPRFDPANLVPTSAWAIGYTILGPLTLSFVQWLTATALSDGIERLYFLAREGQFLKTVYDRWSQHYITAPESDYLVLSRRAITVPAIASLDDIEDLARIRYFPNDIRSFFYERYGLNLNIDEIAHYWPKGEPLEIRNEDIEHIKVLLQTLTERILAQAYDEREGLLAYLEHMGLTDDTRCAVVDIGYSATIQERLNRLLKREVHGYYMATDKRAESVSLKHNVITRGCFAHFADATHEAPAVYRLSFTLEKLLSADEAQIIRYRLGNEGQILSEQRPKSHVEQLTPALRAEIRRGAMDFVDAAISVRLNVLDDFLVPIELANALYETFMKDLTSAENEILQSLVLDDYYCGRGLVA
jgi:LmbE family N-acetylglucosaminyl deacetylase/FMN phosphatase YigB (HAD superfamily)